MTPVIPRHHAFPTFEVAPRQALAIEGMQGRWAPDHDVVRYWLPQLRRLAADRFELRLDQAYAPSATGRIGAVDIAIAGTSARLLFSRGCAREAESDVERGEHRVVVSLFNQLNALLRRAHLEDEFVAWREGPGRYVVALLTRLQADLITGKDLLHPAWYPPTARSPREVQPRTSA